MNTEETMDPTTRQLINRDLDGVLSTAERAALDEVLARDAQARALHEQLVSVTHWVRADRAHKAPVGLGARILARVPAALTRVSGHAERSGPLVFLRRSAAVAAALLVCFAGFEVSRQPAQAEAEHRPVDARLERWTPQEEFCELLRRRPTDLPADVVFQGLLWPDPVEGDS